MTNQGIFYWITTWVHQVTSKRLNQWIYVMIEWMNDLWIFNELMDKWRSEWMVAWMNAKKMNKWMRKITNGEIHEWINRCMIIIINKLMMFSSVTRPLGTVFASLMSWDVHVTSARTDFTD